MIFVRETLVVDPDLGILLVYFDVSPGHVLNYPWLTDFAYVSCTELKYAACRYLI